MTGDLPGPLVVACQFGAIAIVYGALRLFGRWRRRRWRPLLLDGVVIGRQRPGAFVIDDPVPALVCLAGCEGGLLDQTTAGPVCRNCNSPMVDAARCKQ